MPALAVLASAAPAVPTGAGYTLLLLAHVACALVGFGATVIGAVYAAAALAGPTGPRAAAVRRYFAPGANWAGRTLYGVPVFGFALLGVSHGAFSAGDGFVVAGLLLWVAAAVVAELVIWPAERRVQQGVAAGWERVGPDGAFERDCRRMVTGSVALTVAFVAATVLMVGKP